MTAWFTTTVPIISPRGTTLSQKLQNPNRGELRMKHLTLSLLLVTLLVATEGCARLGHRHSCRRYRPCCTCPTCDECQSCPACNECQTLGAVPTSKPAYLASKPGLKFPKSMRSSINDTTPVRLLPTPKSEAGGYYPSFLTQGGE